jgi:hypothetical protein
MSSHSWNVQKKAERIKHCSLHKLPDPRQLRFGPLELPSLPQAPPGSVFTAPHLLRLPPGAFQAAAEQRPQVLRHQGPARMAVLLHWSAAQAPPLGALSTQAAAAGKGGCRVRNTNGGGTQMEAGRLDTAPLHTTRQ